MKKTYEKPEVLLESFQQNENIAGEVTDASTTGGEFGA